MTAMEREAAARRYLLRRKDRNINMLAALQDGLARVAAAEEDGCLLQVAGEIWQLAAENERAALRLYAQLPADVTMLEVQAADQAAALAQRFRPACVEFYRNAWFDGPAAELPPLQGAEVRDLGPEQAGELARYYALPGAAAEALGETEAYLAGRMAVGAVFGLYLSGRLAGFAGHHQEGSIGMLTVLPEYRRQGLGAYLERCAILRILARGWLPFGQVAPDNAASLALQRALGMRVSEETVCWMKR